MTIECKACNVTFTTENQLSKHQIRPGHRARLILLHHKINIDAPDGIDEHTPFAFVEDDCEKIRCRVCNHVDEHAMQTLHHQMKSSHIEAIKKYSQYAHIYSLYFCQPCFKVTGTTKASLSEHKKTLQHEKKIKEQHKVNLNDATTSKKRVDLNETVKTARSNKVNFVPEPPGNLNTKQRAKWNRQVRQMIDKTSKDYIVIKNAIQTPYGNPIIGTAFKPVKKSYNQMNQVERAKYDAENQSKKPRNTEPNYNKFFSDPRKEAYFLFDYDNQDMPTPSSKFNELLGYDKERSERERRNRFPKAGQLPPEQRQPKEENLQSYWEDPYYNSGSQILPPPTRSSTSVANGEDEYTRQLKQMGIFIQQQPTTSRQTAGAEGGQPYTQQKRVEPRRTAPAVNMQSALMGRQQSMYENGFQQYLQF